MTLRAEDFTAFHREVRGCDPFPWQQDLATRVLAGHAWPDLVDVPTGLGKTTVLDIAVFVAAATAAETGAERLGRRRCFFVVDRRLVVDEVYYHATLLANALKDAERTDAGVLGVAARALRSYAPDAGGELLPVTRMRGGTTWDASWLDRPDRPGVIVGTVDQVGSRLLFRGYGVSDRRKPLNAALTGTDALLLVDEAHLATALTTTLAAAHRRDAHSVPVPRTRVVLLTATAATETASRYQLDENAHRDVPEAHRRLTAPKNLILLEATPRDVVKRIAAATTTLATRTAPDSAPARVLVVCNTVDRARAVHSALAQQAVNRRGDRLFDIDLLIGRSRGADRAGLHTRILGLFGLDRTTTSDRRAPDLPAVLVATQTVEVGLNLDADALVTESASWDALVQRLGRLNRLGRHAERCPGAGPARAVVVHDGQADGPVYGAARDHTWAFLTTLTAPLSGAAQLTDSAPGRVDVSPLGCRRLTGELPPGATRDLPGTPVLSTPTLDSWARTGPIPLGDTEVAPFLHGFGTGNASAVLAWRDGLARPADSLDDPFDDEDVPVPAAVANALLTAAPLRSDELIEVPIGAVRAWLTGTEPPAVSDLESATDTPPTGKPGVREPRSALVWRSVGSGPDASASWVWVDGAHADAANLLRPGDQIVVPAEYGGLDAYGWDPGSTARVRDVGDRINDHRRRRLRIDDGLADRLGLEHGEARRALREVLTGLYRHRAEPPTAADRDAVVRVLTEALTPSDSTDPRAEEHGALLHWLNSGPAPTLVAVDEPGVAPVHGLIPRPLLYLLTGGGTGRSSEANQPERDDETSTGSSIGTAQVTLSKHLDAVGRRAGDIAAALGLPDDLTAVLTDAARWHDLGKVEERFQIMLHDGDALQASIAAEPLAKSGLPPEDRNAWRRARLRSALPAGARHEAWSAALVTAYLTERPYPGDADLLVHLVASHHGHARPWLPPVHDPLPRPVTADIDGVPVTVGSQHTVQVDHPARFAALNARYGRWGLALLEAVVRCADMTVSAEGS